MSSFLPRGCSKPDAGRVLAAGQASGSFLKGIGLTVAGTLAGQVVGIIATQVIASYIKQSRHAWVGMLLLLGLNVWVLHRAYQRARRRTAAGILAGCGLLVLLAIALVWYLDARSYAEQD